MNIVDNIKEFAQTLPREVKVERIVLRVSEDQLYKFSEYMRQYMIDQGLSPVVDVDTVKNPHLIYQWKYANNWNPEYGAIEIKHDKTLDNK